MSKILAVATIVCVAMVLCPRARADFVLRSAPVAAAPIDSPPPVAPGAAERDPAKPIPLTPPQRYPDVVRGFGQQVPLSFAVRQIVPSSIHVIYANDIDGTAVVNWTGGQAWNVVLARAVAPLGLHIQVAPKMVTIYR
jgi:hypothetical protein